MEVYVYDDLQAEDCAMLQALYSRSSESVTKHIEKVKESGSGKFMEKFYIGYGHKSIGQCGSTTIFFENVSLLAAKALQDSQLYNGQECSTRYLDFNKQKCFNPFGNNKGDDILAKWMELYNKSLTVLKEYLPRIYPKPEDTNQSEYDRAINAKCFDIARGVLPAAVTTNLSLHTTLAHAADKLFELKFHPLHEVQILAENALEKLKEKYPNSFKTNYSEEEENYICNMGSLFFYQSRGGFAFEKFPDTCEYINDLYKYNIPIRPKGMMLPKYLNGFMDEIRLQFILDFGSFRDFQRHRSVITLMPTLSHQLGFNKWYLEQLPYDFKFITQKTILEQFNRIKELPTSIYNLQYFYPLGTNVIVNCSAHLPALVYILELRTQKTVHPTLRKEMQRIGRIVQDKFPDIPMYIDYDEVEFSLKRGSQTIIEK